MKYVFEWDPNKDLGNRSKHGISFRQATSVFRDPLGISIYDDEHSVEEDRWITIGLTTWRELLVVNHTFNRTEDGQTLIRIFSSRPATRRERRGYEGGS